MATTSPHPRSRWPQWTLAGALLASAAMLAAQSASDISRVNGRVTIESGQTVGKASTVNGAIRLEANAVAGAVSTTNGSIRLDEGARADSIDSVNGSIRLAEGAQLGGRLKGVNGAITLAPGASVDGDVENVNGTVTLDDARIGGRLSTTNGTVLIGAGSRVEGGLLVRKSGRGMFSNRPVRVVIGPGAEVGGRLVFEREVELYLHDSARVGDIEGATPRRYSGDRPSPD